MTDTNRAEPMKPCPFCGGTEIEVFPEEYGSGGQHVPPYHVACNIAAKGCGVSVMGEEEAEAIANWNRRAEVEASRLPLAGAGDAAVQQPVAYQRLVDGKWVECTYFVAFGWGDTISPECRALYTSPLPTAPAGARMPLTETRILEMWVMRPTIHNGELSPQLIDLARAVEAEHGITLAPIAGKGDGNG